MGLDRGSWGPQTCGHNGAGGGGAGEPPEPGPCAEGRAALTLADAGRRWSSKPPMPSRSLSRAGADVTWSRGCPAAPACWPEAECDSVTVIHPEALSAVLSPGPWDAAQSFPFGPSAGARAPGQATSRTRAVSERCWPRRAAPRERGPRDPTGKPRNQHVEPGGWPEILTPLDGHLGTSVSRLHRQQICTHAHTPPEGHNLTARGDPAWLAPCTQRPSAGRLLRLSDLKPKRAADGLSLRRHSGACSRRVRGTAWGGGRGLAAGPTPPPGPTAEGPPSPVASPAWTGRPQGRCSAPPPVGSSSMRTGVPRLQQEKRTCGDALSSSWARTRVRTHTHSAAHVQLDRCTHAHNTHAHVYTGSAHTQTHTQGRGCAGRHMQAAGTKARAQGALRTGTGRVWMPAAWTGGSGACTVFKEVPPASTFLRSQESGSPKIAQPWPVQSRG